METLTDAISFYKHRGFSGRLSETFKFLEHNFTAILYTSLFVLVPCAVVIAAVMTFLPVDWVRLTTSEGGGWLSWGVTLLVSFLGCLCWSSLVYSMFQHYAQSGYIPKRKFAAWMKVWLSNLWRMLLCYLFVGFLLAVFAAIIYMCSTLSLYLGLFFVLVLFVCLVPMALLPSFYMIGQQPLWFAFLKTFRKGIPAWGSTLGLLILTSIFASMVMFLADLPLVLTQAVQYFVALSEAEGEAVVMPGYYATLQFALTALGLFISGLATLLVEAAMLHQYASLVADEQKVHQPA